MRFRTLAAAFTVLASVLVAGATPANAGSGYYELVSGDSHMCAEMAWKLTDSAPAVQYTCYGGNTQLWFEASVSSNPGWYEIKNLNSGKCLDGQWGTTSGTPVVQYTCYGGATQLWQPLPISGSLTYARYVNGAGGYMCLSDNWSHSTSTALVLSSCSVPGASSLIAWTWK